MHFRFLAPCFAKRTCHHLISIELKALPNLCPVAFTRILIPWSCKLDGQFLDWLHGTVRDLLQPSWRPGLVDRPSRDPGMFGLDRPDCKQKCHKTLPDRALPHLGLLCMQRRSESISQSSVAAAIRRRIPSGIFLGHCSFQPDMCETYVRTFWGQRD